MYYILGLKYFDSVVVWANLTNDQADNGWMYLEISSNQHFPDEIQARAAGFAEGFLTRNMIYHYFQGMILKLNKIEIGFKNYIKSKHLLKSKSSTRVF